MQVERECVCACVCPPSLAVHYICESKGDRPLSLAPKFICTFYRSMRDKAPLLSDLMTSKNINILGITETWLTSRETSADLAEMTPKGFSFFHKPRTQRRGGGVGLFISMAHKFTSISLPTQSSFESISGTLECGQSCLNVLNIYRPPGPSIGDFNLQ